MAGPVKVVIVEDNASDVDLCLRELRRSGFTVNHRVVDQEASLREALGGTDWDVVLSDYTLPRFSAMDALKVVRAHRPEIPFIIVTGTIDEESAVNCLKRGADNYVLKSNLARLGPAVEQSLRMRAERRQQRLLKAQLRAPLYSIVDKREKSLLYSENSQSQKRAEIDIFTQKAKNFQSKLSTLDSPKPAEGSL